jgi:hypothetical protein
MSDTPLATHADPHNPWSFLATDKSAWFPYLAPILEQQGQRVTHWQIGASGQDVVLWRSTARAELDTITANLATLVPSPVIGVPCQMGASWPGPAPKSPVLLAATVPPTATPQAVGLAVRDAAPALESGAIELRLVLEPPDLARIGPLAAASQLTKSAVEFWAAASQPDGRLLSGVSLALKNPLAPHGHSHRPQIMPRPEAGAWRNLVERLAGRRIVGTLPAGPGAVCYVLAPAPGVARSRGGALVAWSESADPVSLAGDFGRSELFTVDLFGNRQPLASSASASPRVTLPLTSTPVFIEGVDVDLIRFIAAIAIDPPALESSNEQHERDLVIFNPWDSGISGQFTFLEPGGFETGRKDRTWRISPRTQKFAVAPGKSERIPFKVAFSPVEEVGPKDFVLALELSGQPYGTIEVRRRVEVTAQNLAVDLTATVRDNDLIIEGVFANEGKAPVTLDLTCFAEGFPRSKATINDLPPAGNTLRRFTYAGAASALKGQRVIVSAFDPETKLRVNKSVVVP